MLFAHPEHPGRHVRLGYCLNLHAAESLSELLGSLRDVTLPLRDRFAPTGLFGVGMYLPAKLARHLLSEEGAGDLERLRSFLEEERLDPFTYNAFPYGDFQTDGLKERVYEPLWTDAARARYTLDVARLAQLLTGQVEPRSHISISTHGGRYGPWGDGERRRAIGQ
ncbi:MAG: xylose isomerase, partial [Planctomycetota bacterium]|nr:xylose isomerase [Planctomycetota bacterium]